MSRPKLADGSRRDFTVRFRVTVDERDALHRTAAEAGLSLSDWMRALLLAAAGVDQAEQAESTPRGTGIDGP